MSKPLRVLLVEDVEDDALLLVRELRRGGFEPEWERVEDAQAMRAALADKTWDVILCDYSLPRFSAHAALELVKDLSPDLPVIVISGTVFDKQAGSLLKAGAHDFIRKDTLIRLVPAVEREMSEAEVRRERLRAEEGLRESEGRHRELFELSPIGIWEEDYSAVKPIIDRLRKKGVRDFRRYFREHPKVLRQIAKAVKVIDVNPALIDIYRASNKEAYLRAVTDPSRIEQWCRFYERELAALAAGEGRVVVEHPDKAYDGSDIMTRTITHIGEAYKDSWARVISTAEDITERTEAEKARREIEQRLADITANMPGSIFRRVLHPDGKISFPYEATGFIHGLDPKAVMEDPDAFIDAIHPDDRGKWHEAVRASAKRLERFDLEMRLITPSGETKWARSVAQPHRLDNGDVVWDGVMIDITEQKRAEETIQRLTRQRDMILNSAGEGIYGLDLEGRTTFANPAAATMIGWEPEDLIGQPQHDILHHTKPDGTPYPREECPIYAAFRDGAVHHVTDEVFWRKDGTSFPVEYVSSPIREDGKLAGAVVVFRDITERRRAEDAMRAQGESMRLLHKIAVAANEALVVDEAMQVCLDEVCAYTGWPVGHVYVPADDGTGELAPTKLWHLDYPERFRVFRRVTEATRFAPGVGLPGRVLVSSQPAWIVDVTKDPNFPRAELAKGLGVKAGFAFPVLVGKDVAAVLEFFSEIAAEPDEHILEVMAQLGTQLGRVVERKRAEDTLRESEEHYRELFAQSPIGIVEEDYSAVKPIIDRLRKKGVRDFRRYFREHPKVFRQAINAIKNIDVNQALLDIYRAPDKETFVQWDANPARIDSWMSFYEQELAALAEGEDRFALEHADKAYDDSDIVIRSITHIGDAYKDSWARIVSTEEDITESKRVQAQLIQASKLSTLGEMATGIAHELNQPLSVISMAAERAMDEFEGGDVDLEFISERLKQVIAQTERAAAIIDHTRMFGRLEEDEAPTRIDPRPAIEGALDTIGEQLRVLNIEVATDIPDACPLVLGYEVQLEQVVLNLLSNARDAIEASRGQTDRKGEPLGVIGVNVVVAEYGKEIKMVVRDTGGGIPEAVIDRVFDPFFTTKEKGGGTGLGLSISYGIITDMGGRIEVANVEGGAEFTIRLPVAGADKGA